MPRTPAAHLLVVPPHTLIRRPLVRQSLSTAIVDTPADIGDDQPLRESVQQGIATRRTDTHINLSSSHQCT